MVLEYVHKLAARIRAGAINQVESLSGASLRAGPASLFFIYSQLKSLGNLCDLITILRGTRNMEGWVKLNFGRQRKTTESIAEGGIDLRKLAPEVAIVADICDAFYQGHT
jgi:hypothetical protein